MLNKSQELRKKIGIYLFRFVVNLSLNFGSNESQRSKKRVKFT